MNRIFIITFFLSIGAFAQDSIINYIKNNPMKYFDIKSFEKITKHEKMLNYSIMNEGIILNNL